MLTLTVLFALATITSSVGWMRSRQRRRLAFSGRSGRLAEYVAEFREFVCSVEGAVPEDVEQALRYLEAAEKRGALNPKHPDVPEIPAPGSRLPLASEAQWRVIREDLDVTVSSQQLAVLAKWTERYSFTTKMRTEMMRILTSSNHPEARRLMQIVD